MNLKIIYKIDLTNNRIKHFPSNLLVENLKLDEFHTAGNPGKTSNIDISKISFSFKLNSNPSPAQQIPDFSLIF
jgi:hypothetical protein